MKLSIIVTFHKYKQFLTDCFTSIRENHLSDFETVLVLDHVEEDIKDLIAEYQEDLCMKVVELTGEATGVAAARNAGIDAAEGEYIYILDSDDYLMDDCLPLLLERAAERDAEVAYGRKKYSWHGRTLFLSELEKAKEEEEETDENETGAVAEAEVETEMDAQTLEMAIDEEAVLETPWLELPDKKRLASMAVAHENAVRRLIRKRKGLRNISVLNLLIKKSVLTENNIRFNETCTLYCDMPFMVELLKYAKNCVFCAAAFYVKRKHNDSIMSPALSQLKVPNRMEELMETFRICREIAGETGLLRVTMDRKLVNYFADAFAPNMRRKEGDEWKSSRFALVSGLLKDTHPAVLKKLKPFKKMLVTAGMKGDVKRVMTLVNLQLAKRKVKRIAKNKNELYKYLYKNHYSKQPIEENWVMFETFFGKNYSDSPKYIYEYLATHNTKGFQFIWVLNNDTKPPYGGKVVKRFSREYAYYLAKCKYLVFNVRQPKWFKKRPGQVFLETWHGTPLKRLVFDQGDILSATPTYKIDFYRQSREWDYLVSANPFSTKAFETAFLYPPEKMLQEGYPRNDIMNAPNKDELAAAIRDKIGVPRDKKTVLYAPTWRDDEYYAPGQYKFALALELDKMKEALGDEYVVLLRTHYYIADQLDLTGYEDFAFNVCHYNDISELYLISDICITDYSSVFFDYANLQRPMLFYTYDLDKYRDQLRGFYIDMEKTVPGPMLFTTEEVIDAIKNIDKVTEEYKEKYDAFYQNFCCWDDGHVSERIVNKVFYSEQ